MKLFAKERKLTPSWDLLRPSIDLVRKNIWQVLYLSFLPSLLAIAGLVMAGGELAPEASTVPPTDPRQIIGFILFGVALIWSLLAAPAFLYMQIKAVHGDEVGIMESYRNGLPRLLPLIGMYIIGSFLIVLGLIALIVPGLILIRGFLLAPYYVVEQKLGPVEALRRSYQDTKPVSAYVWGIIGVTLVFALASSVFTPIPVLGQFIALIAGYIYIFAEPIRYVEVVRGKIAKIGA